MFLTLSYGEQVHPHRCLLLGTYLNLYIGLLHWTPRNELLFSAETFGTLYGTVKQLSFGLLDQIRSRGNIKTVV